ncbi:MAG: hypothetical protein MK188_10670 [Gammaproteobacteria bacterium]|nr:hypothetical protein [Gammaproteobacteria bacterium]
MKSPIIPTNFEEWKHCIEVECGLKLSKQFIEMRIKSMEDSTEHYTQQFIKRYGNQYHLQVLGWFRTAHSQLV